eukprot:9155369-Alexandrium_andersonii.AAC.1
MEEVEHLGLQKLLECAPPVLHVSSVCSGIMTFELASQMAALAIRAKGNRAEVRPLWACEHNNNCQEEILNHDACCCPAHVFSDMKNFLAPSVQRKLSQIPTDDVDAKRSLILSHPTVATAYCCKCGQMCTATRADLHC